MGIQSAVHRYLHTSDPLILADIIAISIRDILPRASDGRIFIIVEQVFYEINKPRFVEENLFEGLSDCVDVIFFAQYSSPAKYMDRMTSRLPAARRIFFNIMALQ